LEVSVGPALVTEPVEAVLECLLDVLGLRRMEPERPGRLAAGGGFAAVRLAVTFWVDIISGG
jgi:hypothetical protein